VVTLKPKTNLINVGICLATVHNVTDGQTHKTYTVTTTTTIVLRPFVQDYPGEQVPEETFTNPSSWSSSNLYQLLPSTTIHSILRSNYVLGNLSAQPLSTSSLVYLLVWSSPPHIPYISSPKQCLLLFASYAHTVTACFAVVSRLYTISWTITTVG